MKENSSIKLVFEHEDYQFDLISWDYSQRNAPESDPIEGYQGTAGWWFVLINEKDEILYRQIFKSPYDSSLEVYTGQQSETSNWQYVDEENFMGPSKFNLIAPYIAEAVAIVIFGTKLDENSVFEKPAEELARFIFPPEDRLQGLMVDDFLATESIEALSGSVGNALELLDDGSTSLVDISDMSKRWNIVILPEGYTESESSNFLMHAQAFRNDLSKTEPFSQLWSVVGIYIINVFSQESLLDATDFEDKRTFFNVTHDSATNRFLLNDDGEKLAFGVIREKFPSFESSPLSTTNADNAMMLVNTSVYGGSGGPVALFTADRRSSQIGIHELGHSAFGLADEYDDRGGPNGLFDRYQGAKRGEPNLATSLDEVKEKWKGFIDEGSTLTHFPNSPCSENSSDVFPQEMLDVVGAFEGAYYSHCGIYRPQAECMMRDIGKPFCKVCSYVISKKLSQFLPGMT